MTHHPFDAADEQPDIDRFAAFLDQLSDGTAERSDAEDIGLLAGFAAELQRQPTPRLSPGTKRDLWHEIAAELPRPATGSTPMLPPLTAPQPTRRPSRWSSGSRMGIVPPYAQRPSAHIMLMIAILIAGIAAMAGLGQSGGPTSMTPTARAHDQVVIATPSACDATPATATPVGAVLSTSTPEIATPTATITTCATTAATPPTSE